MTHSRRDILKGIGTITAGAAAIVATTAAEAANPRQGGDPDRRWGMVVDVRKCIGCQACTISCIMENKVPENSYRTIVATYEVKDGDRVGTYVLPRLCNHCSNPPCVPVCPVGATFQQKDGAVVVDGDRCVGCAYCVQACPYDARFINHETNTADKCTFCAHRLAAGLLPACVETCVGGARTFGDLNDPNSTARKLLDAAKGEAKVLKPEQGTAPNVFYIGLDDRFQGRVEGHQTLWQPSKTHG
ncbi:MAG: 4Fe-4S dicluster domain-containing protein [Rhodospirillaceae bacterium]|nr:4Fe-4S dicluster domain-containing protein [Rhodospirillales bacterium]